MKRTPEQEAMEDMRGLDNDLPDFDKLMYKVSAVLLKNSEGLETREIIFRSLMTGATLAAEEYRKSSNGTEEIINKIMEKQMEPDYKWIAQDADGKVCKYYEKEPYAYEKCWINGGRSDISWVGITNPNWRDILIDLEKEDYEIVDGILIRKPKAKKEPTDTELLDAIMEHKLIVDRMDDGILLIWKAGVGGADVINKNGNIRKAIKKWLRKNVEPKPVEDEKLYHLQIVNVDGDSMAVVFSGKEELKKYVESL